MSEIPAPDVRVTRYDVSCIPESHIDAPHLTVTVEYRGRGKWAVLDGMFAYDADGNCSFEPSPSNREDDWLAAHRFDLDTALALARRVAPTMTVNGHSVADVLRQVSGA